MTRRDDIAGALSVVIDTGNGTVTIDGRPYIPPTMAAWQAFPQWQSTTWLTRSESQWTWLVFLILPPGDAESWSELEPTVIDPIRDALEYTVGHVDRVEPVVIPPGDGSQGRPALQFTLTTA